MGDRSTRLHIEFVLLRLRVDSNTIRNPGETLRQHLLFGYRHADKFSVWFVGTVRCIQRNMVADCSEIYSRPG